MIFNTMSQPWQAFLEENEKIQLVDAEADDHVNNDPAINQPLKYLGKLH